MIIDIQKQQNGRSNAQRTFYIGAAYRSRKNDNTWGPWVDTHEAYAIVTADGRIAALEQYLAKRPDLKEHAKTSWQFDKDAQRVWLVRLFEDEHHPLRETGESDALYLNDDRTETQNVLLVY